ncbi:MAG: DUF481 domain-containing protein [Planctomycetes bacterium]|nr:DUF481 domain-containing protein [Planctomycetota bacterium]
MKSHTSPITRAKLLSWCAVFLTIAIVASAPAEDFGGHDFTLRFPAAISRFSSYADVAAGGNAQAASEWSSSVNPASAAWPQDKQFKNGFAPQFTAITFQEGTDLYVVSEAVTLDAGDWGVFLPAAAQIRSNEEDDSTGTQFGFDADYGQIQWGKMISPDLAIGANFNFTSSQTKFDISDTELARTNSETYGFRLGAVHQTFEKVRTGVVFDYAFAPSRTEIRDIFGLGIGTQHINDTTHQFLLRPGIAWEYAKGCDFYFDYQGGVFFNDTGTLWVHRFGAGVDHALIEKILFLRGGVVIDTEGTVSGTTGFGVSLGDRVSLDFAYQYNMFPEIRSEFGPAQTFTVSLSIAF